MEQNTSNFKFYGGASSYLGVALLSALLTVITIGLAYPWAVCMRERWRIENTSINGRRLAFTGSGLNLFGLWIKVWFFCFITLGFYIFWVVPVLTRWVVEHTTFEDE